MRCAIAGSPGGGKSTLFSHLVAELGRRRGVVVREAAAEPSFHRDNRRGGNSCGRIPRARIAVPRGVIRSAGSDWTIYDTPGLTDSVQPSPARRKATAEAIRLLLGCDAIVHVIDASRVGQLGRARGLAAVDSALYELAHRADWKRLAASNGTGGGDGSPGLKGFFRRVLACGARGGLRTRPPVYVMVANKMDLPWAQVGREELGKQFPDIDVIPLAAGRGEGVRLTWRFLSQPR